MKSSRIAYFDCFSGISGDMVLGALVDAGAELREIESRLRGLGLENWSISAEKVQRGAIFATHVKVKSGEEHHHRGLSVILKRIDEAHLAPRAAARAAKIFERLAAAEAKVHNIEVEKVHFHEVGAVDSIVDIVGSAIGFELLGIGQIVCSPLNVGGGRVKTEHGVLPVPAPATAELLRGAPTYSSGIEHELVTPTGAAIVSTVALSYGAQPAMTVDAIGQGAGSAEFAGHSNILRLFVGDAAEQTIAEQNRETVVVLEANFDDMNPQIYGYFADRAFAAGALDVFSTAVYMKKNRPGQLVTVLCDAATEQALTEMVFRETTTLGVRRSLATRQTLQRVLVTVKTEFGAIRVKVARMNGRPLNVAPEYDDCRAAATENGVPLKRVLAEASYEFQKRLGAGN